jgi:hypothetical protein
VYCAISGINTTKTENKTTTPDPNISPHPHPIPPNIAPISDGKKILPTHNTLGNQPKPKNKSPPQPNRGMRKYLCIHPKKQKSDSSSKGSLLRKKNRVTQILPVTQFKQFRGKTE